MPAMPTVVLPHPIGGTQLDTVLAKVDKAFDEILAKLTTPLPSAGGAAAVVKGSERVEIACTDEWTDLQREMNARGWATACRWCRPPSSASPPWWPGPVCRRGR